MQSTKDQTNLVNTWFQAMFSTPNTQLLEYYHNQYDYILSNPTWTSADKQDLIRYLHNLAWNTAVVIQDEDVQVQVMRSLDTMLVEHNVDIARFLPDVLANFNLDYIKKILENCSNFTQVLQSYPDQNKLLEGLFIASGNASGFYDPQNGAEFYAAFVPVFEKLFGKTILEFRGENGQTLLHILASYSATSEFVHQVRLHYPELMNVLDANGNSALYFPVSQGDAGQNGYHDQMCYSDGHDFVREMLNGNAKYVRNHLEEKTPLHLKVTLHIPLQLKPQDKIYLNTPDLEHHRTPLHYAIILGNDDAANELIQFGASFDMPDKFHHTELYYAFSLGKVGLVKSILSGLTLSEQKNFLQQLTSYNLAHGKNSYFAAAALSGNQELYDLSKELMQEFLTKTDKAILHHTSVTSPDNTVLLQFSPQEQLAILSAAGKQNRFINASNYTQTAILPKMFTTTNTLPAGAAYGVELEISNLPCSSYVPVDSMLKLFDAKMVHDGSVTLPFFSESNVCFRGEEIVSGVLNTTAKVEELLFLTQTLHESGATTNKSNGLHVHVNIKGDSNGAVPSITSGMQINDYTTQEVELAIVKQLLVNWSQVEQLLQGVLRNGELLLNGSRAAIYTAPMQHLVPHLLDSESFDDLLNRVNNRYQAFNVMSLAKHGTVEVRMHEGTLNPKLIKSWLNFIHRLTRISVDQVQEKVQANTLGNFTAYPQVKNLVHIWLAERDYANTWDNSLKTFIGSTDPVTTTNSRVQSAIYEAASYKLYNEAQYNVTEDMLDAPVYARPFERADIDGWTKLSAQYPGILPFNSPVPNLSRETLPTIDANLTKDNGTYGSDFMPSLRGTPPDHAWQSNAQDYLLALPLFGLVILMLAYLAKKISYKLHSFDRYRARESAKLTTPKGDEPPTQGLSVYYKP